MSTQVQRRKGTTVQHSTFTGASAELTVDTTKNTVVVHDGATAGGIPLAKETGSAISATSLSLPNSTTNGVAFVNSSKVVVAGSTFTFDGTNLSVNGITVGKGAGSSSFNTAVGELALGANTSSATNTAIGYNAMKAITTGSGNTAVGAVALTLASDTGNNTAIGRGALFPSTGTQNTALGYNAGGSMSSGSKNVIIGSFSGNDISYGTGFDIRTLNNYIVLSDGDANVRAYWNGANPTFPGALTLSDGTANGVPYLNGSKVLTSGTALTFDGTQLNAVGAVIGVATPLRVSNSSATTNGRGAGLEFFGASNTFGRIEGFWAGADEQVRLFSTGSMTFSTAGAEQMRLTSTGLGIGTSSPGAKLHLYSSANTIEIIEGATTNGAFVEYKNGTSDFYIGVNNSVGTLVGGVGGAYGSFLASYGAYPLGFGTNGAEKMRLDSSGNLGVGATSGFNAISGTETTVYIKNSGANIASLYIEASRKWAVISGTSGQLGFYDITAGSERASIDSSGNLMVGTTSPAGGASKFNVYGTQSYDSALATIANWYSGGTSIGYIGQGNYAVSGASSTGISFASQSSMSFATGGQTERARIDASGNLLLGATSGAARLFVQKVSGADGVVINGDSTAACLSIASNSSTMLAAFFATTSGTAGQILCSGTTTTYATSSDYRLKNITGPITTSGAYIDSLKPVEGTWKADGSTFVGLIAHETQEVSRTTVATGTKDGEQMQGMDYSSAEIIANLIAELQSVRTRLAALEAK